MASPGRLVLRSGVPGASNGIATRALAPSGLHAAFRLVVASRFYGVSSLRVPGVAGRGGVRTSTSPPPRRSMGMMSQFANLASGAWSADAMRELERAANSRPGDVTSQAMFAHALLRQGFAAEVVHRVESGKFAVNLVVLEVYARAAAALRGLSETHARHLSTALSQAYASGSGFISPDTIRAVTAAEMGGAAAAYNSHHHQPLQSPSSSSSSSSYYASGAAQNYHQSTAATGGSGLRQWWSRSPFQSSSGGEDPYFGSNPTFVPGSSGSSSGAAGNAPGSSSANPLVVQIAPGRASMFNVITRLLGLGLSVTLIYYLLFSKSGGFGPLAQLTGDIVEEVTDVPSTRFTDVKGVDEAKQELQDIVEFLRDPEKFRRLGAKVPRGVLLTGPPGTGKTLLARAVAGEAGCKFYSKSASEFEEMLVGLGARRVRDLFAAARKNAPAIIFLDEIDALGGKRQKSIGSNSERQTLNQLLSCMDGFTKNENVIVIAATNSPEILDPALKRPGRFDTTVDVPLPDVKGRQEIIDLYLSRVVVAPDIDANLLARATPGFSGAQLEAMINSAALMAAQRGAARIETQDVEEARDKVIMGPAKKSRLQKQETMRLTAYHEGGHTLAAIKTIGAQDLHKVTILPRGASGGATYSLPKDEEMMTREAILAHIDVAMGGRVAEELVFGPSQVTTGAGSDMAQASQLARRYVMAYSMSPLGLTSYADGSEPSPERKAAIDEEVERILQDSYGRVTRLITDNRRALDTLATALLDFETLDAAEVKEVLAGRSVIAYREATNARSKAATASSGGNAGLVSVGGSHSGNSPNRGGSGAKAPTGATAPGTGPGGSAAGDKGGTSTGGGTSGSGRLGGVWAAVFRSQGGSNPVGTATTAATSGKGVVSAANSPNAVDSHVPTNIDGTVTSSTSAAAGTGSKASTSRTTEWR